jgi:hypothetical protein
MVNIPKNLKEGDRHVLLTLSDTLTLGRTPLDEGMARRRDLYLTTHSTPKRYSCPWQDSNPQSQQSSGRSPMPQNARTVGSAHALCYHQLSGVSLRRTDIV